MKGHRKCSQVVQETQSSLLVAFYVTIYYFRDVQCPFQKLCNRVPMFDYNVIRYILNKLKFNPNWLQQLFLISILNMTNISYAALMFT